MVFTSHFLCRFNEPFEKRMGMIGAAPEFRMILYAYIKRTIRKFYGFHQSPVRRSAADYKPLSLKQFTVLIVKFVTMPMPFTDQIAFVTTLHRGSGSYHTGICPQSQCSSLVYVAALPRHKINGLICTLLIEFP